MAGAAGGVKVKGLREMNLAFKLMSKAAQKEARQTLMAVGEPVRAAAEAQAVTSISNIGERWSRMRLGVTSKMVYIAPRARNRGGSKRGNLAVLLLEDSMWPAVSDNEERVVEALDRMLDALGRKGGF